MDELFCKKYIRYYIQLATFMHRSLIGEKEQRDKMFLIVNNIKRRCVSAMHSCITASFNEI